jgi:hypothetical protein
MPRIITCPEARVLDTLLASASLPQSEELDRIWTQRDAAAFGEKTKFGPTLNFPILS